jgi:protein-tyrosine phosphatase
VKNFFEKREKSLNALLTVYDKEVHPALYLGAEVAYFHGISRAEDLREMCIQGTNLFLLELPFCKWDDALVSEVFELMENLSVKVVLAHINRYLPHKNAKYLDIMQKGGVLLQANAEWFLEKRPLKKALKYLKAEKISCLGSDAHNLLTRPPRFKEALINVQNKIGDDKLKAIELTTKKLLSKATKI